VIRVPQQSRVCAKSPTLLVDQTIRQGRGMRRCEADQGLLEFDLRELDKFRRLTEHKEIATARAMDYCATRQVCPPEWLVVEAASLMIELLKREKTNRRGSTASHLARFHQELKDVERWDAVLEVRRIREEARHDDSVLKARPRVLPDGLKRSYENRKEWLKQGTFECAASLLEGRDAYVTAYGVRKSYQKVERYRNDPSSAIGAWFEDPFLNKLGIQGALDRKPGKKTFLFWS
jgi:hypothetical protein